MQAKLNPLGKLSFPGFQEILDFTSAGSESSVSVAVDGDTDKEYKIIIRNLDATDAVSMLLNNDSTNGHYGYQYIYNNAGSISAARSTTDVMVNTNYGLSHMTLLTPSGFLKTLFYDAGIYTSGTTMGGFISWGAVWNYTTNVTSLNFLPVTGSFTSGTRITVFARRA